MQERLRGWGLGAIVLCAAVGCGSDAPATPGPQGVTPAGGAGVVPPAVGTAGKGAAGSTPTPPRATGGAGGAAGKPTGSGGAGGTAVVTTAGTNGGAGVTASAGGSGAAAAGAGGAGTGAAGGGAGATAPAGTCGPSAFACRGPDPTMATALGSAKGPYATGMMTSGYKNGDQFADATIYYPKGDAKPPFGCVSVCPGFASPQSSIQQWGPFLASHGIVTITIGTNSTSDPPQTRALALMDALETCKAENDRADSPIKGMIDKEHVGVSGWSMGGGGTLIAAENNPTLKAAVSFAAWQPSSGAKNMVPVLMFEGTADALAAGMSEGFYSATPDSVSKMLFEVQGAPHEVANDPKNQMGLIGLYGLSWWKVFLEGDERYRQLLLLPKPSITAKYMTNVK
jgi:dienelactone hydrolase